jgi:hypothetical protein
MQAGTLARQSSRIAAHDYKKALKDKIGTKEDYVYLPRRPRRAHAC